MGQFFRYFVAFIVIFSELAVAKQIVCLRREEAQPSSVNSPPLVRELFRQGILIAARDQLGLPTRDQTLREPFPKDAIPLDLQWLVKSDSVEITLGYSGKQIWHESIPYQAEGDDSRVYKVSAVTSERLSRTTWPDLLTKVGFTGSSDKDAYSAAPPPQAEKDLREFDMVHQFAAVRLAHTAIHDTGSSPERLSILVQGYANLSRLTDTCWYLADDAFAARSILYAQRMVAEKPRSAFALWNRAYAYALAGCHHFALEDLAAAHQLIQSGQCDDPKSLAEPAWVPLIDAYCHYDIGRLSQGLSNETTAPLASLLCFFSVEYSGSSTVTVEYAKTAMQLNPRCLRLLDGMNFISGVGLMRATTAEAFVILSGNIASLRSWPDLPVAASAELKKPRDAESPLSHDMVAAADMVQADDSQEPSYAVLGRLVQETYFANAMTRAFFLDQILGVDASSFVEAAKPLIPDHPYIAWLDCFIGNRFSPARYAPLSKFTIVDPNPVTYILGGQYSQVETGGSNAGKNMWDLIVHSHDVNAQTTELYLSRLTRPTDPVHVHLAHDLLRVSPFDAVARGMLIADDFDSIKDSIPQWEMQIGDHPDLLAGLAQHDIEIHDYDKAKDLLQQYLKIAPDVTMYQRLAGMYLQQHDEANWLKTLQQGLQAPDYGLGHTQIQVEIANHFMDQGQFQQAKPYADAAARSYAEWGMQCAIRCDDGLGQYDDAYAWLTALVSRYGDAMLWYIWCQQTGHGDLQQATAAAQSYAARLSPVAGREMLAEGFQFYYLQGQFADATRCLHAIFDSTGDPWAGMNLAMVQDEQGNRVEAEQTLEKIVRIGPSFKSGGVRTQMIAVARLILGCLKAADAGGPAAKLELGTVRSLSKDASARDLAHIDFFVAKFFETNKQQLDQVQPLLRSAARSADISTSGVFAAVELRHKSH
ncbi:MAG TPA: hypothetical protein VG722_04555 [Tepidisphaeraceae bacterium]|nr:hypothetical protein [Tepidisphaeraceae bacterium]